MLDSAIVGDNDLVLQVLVPGAAKVLLGQVLAGAGVTFKPLCGGLGVFLDSNPGEGMREQARFSVGTSVSNVCILRRAEAKGG